MRLRTIGAALAAAILASAIGGGAASAQTKCPPGQIAMPRKPPTGAFVGGKCVATSEIAANQQMQDRDKKSCPSTLKYVPRQPAGRNCIYWDEPG